MRNGLLASALALLVGLLLLFTLRPLEEAPAQARAGSAGQERAGLALQPVHAEDVGARGTAEAGSTPPLTEAPTAEDGLLDVEVVAADRPLGGTQVRLYWRGTRDPNLGEVAWRLASEAVTDAAGHAALPSRPGAYLVVARAAGRAPARREVVRPYGEARTPVRLVLEPGVGLEGRTVVKGSEEPLPLVELVLTAHGRTLEGWERAEAPAEERVYGSSDARGAFRLEGLAPGSYQLEARAPGHARAVLREVRVPAAGPVTVALPLASIIEGFVVDAQGRPAAGSEVLVGGSTPQVVTTGEGGGFSAEVESGAHTVAARRGAETGALDRPVVVGAGKTVRDVHVRLGAGAWLEGRVVARASGRPVAGATVDVAPAGAQGDSGRAVTDAEGAFAVRGLAPGSYDVVVNAPGFSQERRRGVTVAQGERFPLEVRLAGTGTVAGTVRDGAGRPVLGARVVGGSRWGGALGATYAEARTDADGRYRLSGLNAGSTWLHARREAAAVGRGQQVVVPEGAEAQADFTLEETGTVEGVVRPPRGALPSEPLVAIALPMGQMRLTSSEMGRADVDGAGAFRLVLPPGPYSLRAAPVQGARPGAVVNFAMVVVEAGQTAHVELTYEGSEQGEGNMRGVVLEPDGSPSAGAAVSVVSAGPEGQMRLGFRTDEEGRFAASLPRTPQEGSTLTVAARNGGRSGTVQGAPPGREVVVRLQPGAAVHGRVARADGEAVQGFRLTVQPLEAQSFSGTVREFPAERFALSDVPAERLKLVALTSDGLRGEAEVAPGAGQDAEVDIVLRGSAGLRGRVVDAKGTPVAGAVAHVAGVQLLQPQEDTGVDGRFAFEGLPPGERTVQVMAQGGQARRTVTLAEGQVLELGDLALEPRRAPPGSIGAGVSLSGGQVVLVAVMPEGPAAQAGLKLGDGLLAVDGTPVKDPADASQRLNGAPGSTVTVRVRRGGTELTLTVTRAS